jgi:alpha-maltose-1-phosphate synthase
VSHWKPGRLMASGELTKVVQAVRPDVIHLHGGILATSLALTKPFRDIPVVATVYQLLPVPSHELNLRNFVDARRSSLRPGRIIASAIGGLPLARKLLHRGGIEVVCTPDPRVLSALKDFGPVIKVSGGASPSPYQAQWSSTPTVGFAGRAEPGRGVEELVQAVAILRNDIPNLRLRLLLLPGPAGERWQETFGAESHIDLSIGILNDLAYELSKCQVVALPFRIPATITPPLVAAEAMSVGVPVVANHLSCMTPLITTGVNGILTKNASAQALAEALGTALKAEPTWIELSNGARRTIENEWSWSGAGNATRSAYRVAVQRHHRRREIDPLATRSRRHQAQNSANENEKTSGVGSTEAVAGPRKRNKVEDFEISRGSANRSSAGSRSSNAEMPEDSSISADNRS